MSRLRTALKYSAATLGVAAVTVFAAAVATPVRLQYLCLPIAFSLAPNTLAASQLPLERASASKVQPRAAAGDASPCPVLNGGVSFSADVLQQMARHHGGDSGASLLLGTDASGARVYASEADLLERDLRVMEWQLRLARKLRLQAPPEVVAARDRAQAELKRTRGWW
jgi:hypothetical protein